MNFSFEQALVQKDLSKISQFPKSDIHSHAGRGGNKKYITQSTGVEIPLPPKKFGSLEKMQQWYAENIRSLVPGVQGQIKRWEACFKQAAADSISVLALSFSPSEIALVGGMKPFIEILEGLKKSNSPQTLFLPELTFDRASDVPSLIDTAEEILSYRFFQSVDVCCNEKAQPIQNFKPLYRKAKEHGLKLKTHVGEFGTAEDVLEAVEELELDEVHHGIAAADSAYVMKELSQNKIQLNVCPTSNVMLDVVDEYRNHPIKLLYEAGVPLTINTDDLLIFNQSVSEEYLNLFTAGTLDECALNEIRLNGISEKPNVVS